MHLYGARSTYDMRLRAARMRARADRLEGREATDPVAVTAEYVRRIYEDLR